MRSCLFNVVKLGLSQSISKRDCLLNRRFAKAYRPQRDFFIYTKESSLPLFFQWITLGTHRGVKLAKIYRKKNWKWEFFSRDLSNDCKRVFSSSLSLSDFVI